MLLDFTGKYTANTTADFARLNLKHSQLVKSNLVNLKYYYEMK